MTDGNWGSDEQSDMTGSKIARRTYLGLAGTTGLGLIRSTKQLPDMDRTSDGPSRSKRPSAKEVLVGVEKKVADIKGTVEHHVPASAEVLYEDRALDYAAVRFPDRSSSDFRERFVDDIERKDGIRYAEPNKTLQLLYVPNDPEYDVQDAAKTVNADEAWDITTGDPSVMIAIVDQGVKYDHPDLANNMDATVSNYGKDFVDSDSDPYPDNKKDEFHGTHVAGIAAAETDNSEGIAGICDASVLSCRVANEEHVATRSDLASGVRWATDNDADVINISLGESDYSQVVKDAVSYAFENGALVVAAAGNQNGGSVEYPAAMDECIAVSALNTDGGIAGFSSTGSPVELAAPGTAVLSASTTDGYVSYSGTSMAAPVVSGVAALILSQWPNLTNEELRKHLRRTAVDLGLDANEQGYGRVDAYNAVVTKPQKESVGDATVVEDFEDGDLSEYSVDRGSGHSLVSTPAYDANALELADDTTEIISTNGLVTYPQAGDTFTVRFRTNGTGGGEQANFTWGVQDHENRYYVVLNPGQLMIRLFKYENGSSKVLSDEVGASFQADAWYLLEIEWKTDGTQTVTLYEEDGAAQIAQVTGSDSEWTTGGIGFDAYLSTGESVYFDNLLLQSEEADGAMIENFEDGDLSEYSVDRGSGHSLVSTPAYDAHALEMTGDTTEIISTNGLNKYPVAGDTFTVRFRTNGIQGGEQANFTWGVQDHENRYFVLLHPSEQRIWLFKCEDGNSETFSTKSEATFEPDTWYLMEVEWALDGTQTVTLYEEDGTTEIASVSGTDTTWTDGGIGFDAYLSSGEAVYFDEVLLSTAGNKTDPVLIDGFEDGDMNEYSIIDTSDWSATTNNPRSGSYAAEMYSKGDGLYNNGYTIERGDSIKLSTYLGTKNGESTGLELWAFTNSNASKRYIYYISAEEERHWLGYYNNGSYDAIEAEGISSVSTNEWLRMEIRTDSSTVESNLYDSQGRLISTLSGTDTRLTSGGYGFKDEWASEDVEIYVDDIRITRESASSLDIIDNFSSGGLISYASVGSSAWATTTERAFSGSYAASNASNGDALYNSGYTYERNGPLELRAYLGTSNGASSGLEFWFCTDGDASEKYVHYVSAEENEHFLVYQPQWGERQVIDHAYNVNIPSNEWLRMEVNGTDSVIEGHVYDHAGNLISTLKGNDSNLASGGYGFKDRWRAENPSVYVDYVRGP
jgi:serine protease